MNGAESLVRTLLAGGVDTCFANPGTSEMHFVAALDRHPEMRCVLCLFEGGATGAADGWHRMRRDVAATLLHLGPGLANGLANLHNARKAGSGILNIVGDHTEWHLAHDSPLRGDLEGIARTVSHWTRTAPDAPSVAPDGAEAIRAARSHNGRIATLILRAHAAWEDAPGPAPVAPPPPLRRPDPVLVTAAARALAKPGAALLIDGPALHGPLAETAGRIAAKTGCKLIAPYLVSRIARGAGAVRIERLKYVVEDNVAFLADTTHLILCGALRPVSFFSYPGKPSLPEPPGCPILDLCTPEMDIAWTLDALAAETGATATEPARMLLDLPALPTGPTTSTRSAPPSPPSSRTTPSWSTRPSPPAARSSPRPRPPAPPTGSTSAAAPSASACPARPAPRWPVPSARPWRSWATARRCTRCNPSGRWPART